MKTLRFALALFSLVPALGLAQVVPHARRAAALAAAQEILQARETAVPAAAPNPFFSDAFAAQTGGSTAAAATEDSASAARPTGPRSARELLATIADGLRPSGFIVMGGVPSLSFGQKRVKAGDTLTITFEGTEYALEIAAIDRTHFTVRLGNETHTRPIK